MIKMRFNKDSDARCNACGAIRENSLGMFDIAFGNKNMCTIFTVCDVCCRTLCDKTLKAVVSVNGRTKSPQDLVIIRSRQHGTYKKDVGNEN